MPKILRSVFPKLTSECFEKEKNSFLFQSNKVSVCENCYLKIMDGARFYEYLPNLTKNELIVQKRPQDFGQLKQAKIQLK